MNTEDLFAGRLVGLAPVEARVGRLHIAVDPRLELMSVVQMMSDYPARWPTMTQLDSEYRRDVETAFGPHRDHEAVRLMNELLARPASVESPPFAFSGPVDFALHLDAAGCLHPWMAERPLLALRVGGEAMLHRIADRLGAFFRDADFARFYAAHVPLYTQLVADTVERAGADDDLAALERFFGTTRCRYTAVLVPLYGTVGFGPGVGPLATPQEAVYNVLGPVALEGERLVFGSVEQFTYMKRHEFSHPFVNPLVDHYWHLVAPYDQFDRIAEAMRARSYGEWRDAVYEHLVRATTTWLAFRDGPEAGAAAMAAEVKRGFIFVPALIDKIRAYEARRDRYPTLASYFPELVKAFA